MLIEVNEGYVKYTMNKLNKQKRIVSLITLQRVEINPGFGKVD